MRLPVKPEGITLAAKETWEMRWRSILAAPSRSIAIRVNVLDPDEAPLGSAIPTISGKVTIDANGSVSRAAEFSAIDPDRELGFESDSPGEGALYADRFVQIDYGVREPVSGEPLWTPIFRGPLVRYERSGAEVAISASGKEVLLQAPNYPFFKGNNGFRRAKRTRVDDILRDLAAAVGERELNIPQIADRTKEKTEIASTKEVWPTMKAVAELAAMDLFYDGSGTLTARERGTDARWTFDGDFLRSWPKVSYDLGGDFRNVIKAIGKASGERDKHVPKWIEVAPGTDPLSPSKLARNGKPRWIGEQIQVNATKLAKVKKIAEVELDRRMRQAVVVEFSSVPVPGLEERDGAYLIPPGERQLKFIANRFGFDLGTGEMSVGTDQKNRVATTDRVGMVRG